MSFFSFSAVSEEIQDKKVQYVSGIVDRVFEILEKENITKEKRTSEIMKRIEKEVNFDWNSRMAIGSYGRSMSEAQIKEFSDLYKKIVLKSWSEKFSIADRVKRSEVAVSNRVTKINQKDDIVECIIQVAKGNSKISVKVVVNTVNDDKFIVNDLVVEGVSIALSYRNQFTSYIEKNGVDSIIPYLRSMIEDKGRDDQKKKDSGKK